MSNLQLASSFPLSVRSLPYMVSIDFLKNGLSISVEENPIRIELARRSENDPVGAESY